MKIIDKRGDRDATREFETGPDRAAGETGARVESGNEQSGRENSDRSDEEGVTVAAELPPRQPETQQDLRPAVCEYALGIAVRCGHCGEQQFHASPQFVQGAMMNAGFQGPCPKCKGIMIMQPKQSVIMVPQERMQAIINRGQRRAHEAVLRKGGNGSV